MKEFKVIIPKESFSVLTFYKEGLPGLAVINTALCDFEPKEAFAWHLSIIMDYEEVVENGMPSKEEDDIIYKFGNELDLRIKGDDLKKPVALFLGRITWNKTKQMIWRICDPEIVDKILNTIIDSKSYPRQFDYIMKYDAKWKLTESYLVCGERKRILPKD